MKKTLLMAAAALAAGVISSQAQVYSQNVVGYANVVTPQTGVNYLIAIPFKIGVSNGANEVFGSSLPDFSTVSTWSPNSNTYKLYYVDSTSPSGWVDGDFAPIAAPTLPVGAGFFLSPNGNNVTNTFVGAVAVNVGTSNVMSLPTSGANYLVGCAVPYAGSVTNGSNSGGGPNLNGLPDFTTVSTWSPSLNAYKLYYADSTSPTLWVDGDFATIQAPSIQVGEAFFISPNGSATWTTGL